MYEDISKIMGLDIRLMDEELKETPAEVIGAGVYDITHSINLRGGSLEEGKKIDIEKDVESFIRGYAKIRYGLAKLIEKEKLK